MKSLNSFQDIHGDKFILVCGCGESLNDLERPERFITIGVNDVGRKLQPNYLVVVNPRNQFSGDRFSFVETSNAEYIFTQLDLNLKRENIVKFALGTFGGTDFSNPNVLHYTNNSPYIALCLAITMGAKRIGLIGVDFTDHHFFERTGKHPLAPQFEAIDEQYKKLANAAESCGVEIYNLSRVSRLTAFWKISIEEFQPAETAKKSAPLQIVSYATTPVAGVPAILARCINAKTEYAARCVWATNDYGNGVSFAGDVEWNRKSEKAESLIKQSDLIIVHNGKIAPAHEKLFTDKATITMAHNYLWNVDTRFIKKGFPGAVVGQYQATLAEFKDWAIVPNPMPFWEAEYQPSGKNEAITICYTPSGKHEKYPPEHKLYWHSKGYETTLKILKKLAKLFPVKLELIINQQISHAASLAMKRRSHIVIDECVTGSYHRNSLEGLAGGAVVVNGIGILPQVGKVLQFCAGGNVETPFVPATLETLETVLIQLIESGKDRLIEAGAKNRKWLEENWDFGEQWETFWLPLVEKSLRQNDGKISTVKTEMRLSAFDENGRKIITNGSKKMKNYKSGVSVVVPHGGAERLPHLRTCLVNLRQCGAVSEIIVVEMGERIFAEKTARRWADKYVFIHHAGAFERARALNTGGAFAECEFVFWLDNDLLMAHDFFAVAAAEMRCRNLDYLKPYSETFYLNAADTEFVMHGTRSPETCRPTNVLRMSGSGRAEIVRKDFLINNGGVPEGFRGWGGEDNAWSHKAHLLGKTGTTQNRNQKLYHLFHLLSGGYGGELHKAANPHYAANVELLNEIFAVRDAPTFSAKFPLLQPCPWNAARKIVFIADAKTTDSATETAAELAELFGAAVETISAVGDIRQTSENLLKNPPDAIVFFTSALAEKFLSQHFFAAEFAGKSVALADANFDSTTDEKLFALSAIVKTNAVASSENLQLWSWKNDTAEPDFQNLALTLAQPLSLILGKAQTNYLHETVVFNSLKSDLPVWFYWEGARPEWIEACHETILAKAPNARFLTPESFKDLWTEDLDINIERLYVAHRADYIRAYLLAKFGGLWLDADCVVMQDLQVLLDKLGEYDFIAHRERSGFYTNDLMAAKKDSVIAGQFYERICQTLRKNQTVSWRAIGGEPLTEILHNTAARFLELDCRQIQPICWSEPEKFFAAGNESEHSHKFDADAICYMLSNGAVINYQKKFPDADLTAENTFFSFLVRRALDEKAASEIVGKSFNAPNSENENRRKSLAFYLEMIAGIAPQTILDLNADSGRWGFLLRDLFEPSNNKEDWKMTIEGVSETKLPPNYFAHFYNRVSNGGGREYVRRCVAENGEYETKNLTILDDYLVRAGNLPDKQILEQTLQLSDYVLLNLERNGRFSNDWLETHSEQIVAQNGSAANDCFSLLLSNHDPKNLRPKSRLADTFDYAAQIFTNQKEESISGPGSSLKQTAELRRRLPLLIAHLEINSILDAPCGDFNWLRHCDLRLEKYVGVDVVRSIVERNQNLYAAANRRFIAADITRDYLPRCDLILCRDCLVHLSFAEIFAALRGLRNSGAEYLLTTTFPKTLSNADIRTGDWRTLNFQLPPFNLPPPLHLLNENCTEGSGKFADKSLGLWAFSDMNL